MKKQMRRISGVNCFGEFDKAKGKLRSFYWLTFELFILSCGMLLATTFEYSIHLNINLRNVKSSQLTAQRTKIFFVQR